MNPQTDDEQIRTALYDRDIEAFLDRDWSRVRDDFDAAAFIGYRRDPATGQWVIEYPTLDAYRDDWLRQAESVAGADRAHLSGQLYGLSSIAEIQIDDGRALVRKEFDGAVDGPGGTVDLAWTTYYFLRRSPAGRWLVTGFVGHLPRADGRLAIL
jgi:hypothetical protein